MRLSVLIGCEFSGTVRRAFRDLGHDAWSCDLEPAEDGSPFHIQGDLLDVIHDGWDLAVFFPPCTYLSRAGARWWKAPGRDEKAAQAAAFVQQLWNAPIPRLAIENPIGQLNRRWRYPDQVIEPWMFGDPYTKRTCLWLKNLPPLMATVLRSERTPWLPSNTGGARRGEKSHPGTVHTAKDGSRTFPGVARAMARQWAGEARELRRAA